MQNRFWEIDFIRGISIFLVILIHCTVYFLSNPVANFFWVYSQFAVPAFVFCSFFLYFQKDHLSFDSFHSLRKNYFPYLKKRFIRLLKPYYIFALIFFVLLVSINPLILNTKYIIQSLILTGGIEINWLILLFLQLTMLLPFLSYLLHKQKSLAYFFFLLATLSALFVLIYHTPYALSHKLVSWLPWSVMLFFTFLFTRYKDRKHTLTLLMAGSGLLLGLSTVVLIVTNQTLLLRDHKYPPDAYFLSYGMFCILFLYMIAPHLKLLKKPLRYLSTCSYQIYFIHYFYLIWFASIPAFIKLPWWIFFALVFGVTIATLVLFQKLMSLRGVKRHHEVGSTLGE